MSIESKILNVGGTWYWDGGDGIGVVIFTNNPSYSFARLPA